MKHILLKYYNGGTIDTQDVRLILNEYAKRNNREASQLVEQMLALGNHPFAYEMITQAMQTAVRYLSSIYDITILYDKNGNRLKAY